MFVSVRYDPLYISKEMVFGVFTGFPLRKNFAMKEQLDWVIMHLQAGGFWLKWNRDMFDEKVSGSRQVIGFDLFSF